MTEENARQDAQPGADAENENHEGNPSGTGSDAEIQALKKEISELRKEAAKYRTSAKSAAGEKQTVEEQLKALQDEFAQTKRENMLVKRQALLDKAGCIKSDLVVNVIPEDCEDVAAWIEAYKKDNDILFKRETASHGGGYKPSGSKNLNASELMNSYIRQAAGR